MSKRARPLFLSFTRQTSNTWIYAVQIDESDVFSTHNKQIHDGAMLANVALGAQASKAWWCLYAHEVAVKEVAGNRVVAAVPCQRSIPNHYRLLDGSIRVNQNSVIDGNTRGMIIDIFHDIGAGGWQRRATPGSGWHRSTGK